MALPLVGLRVVDLTKDFAGPFCTMILADLGAEVIKVEKPGLGDETRAWGPPFVRGQSCYFLSLNRGKKSVALDLRTREAQKVIRELVVDSDFFVESFQPGTLSKMHLDTGLLLHIRLRADRTLQEPARIRLNSLRHERHHEHNRRKGPASDQSQRPSR